MKAISWLRKYCVPIGIVLFVLLSMWWYGIFPEIGKTDEDYLASEEALEDFAYQTQMVEHNAGEETLAEIERQILKHQKRGISRMSTKALIETMINMGAGNAIFPYSYPEIAYDYKAYLDEMAAGEESYLKFVYRELVSRGGAGRELLRMYQSFHPLQSDGLDYQEHRISMIELLLAQPEMRLHFTSDDLECLRKTAYQLQWEKFYGYQVGYNLLDRKSYDKNGWNEERVAECMRHFSRLQSNLTREEAVRYFDDLAKQEWQEQINAESHTRFPRFEK